MKTCKKGIHQYEGRQCNQCHKDWQKLNKEYLSKLNKKYVAEHRDRLAEKRLLNRKSKEEHYKAVAKRYRQNNKAKRSAQQAKRKADKMFRTPAWLTELQHAHIQIFYDSAESLSKEFGRQMDVDHIIPLKGKTVSGLHVPWNLQVIPHEDNMSKGNR